MDDKRAQGQKFKDAARKLGTDEEEARWEERLRKVAKKRPAPEKPE